MENNYIIEGLIDEAKAAFDDTKRLREVFDRVKSKGSNRFYRRSSSLGDEAQYLLFKKDIKSLIERGI